MEGNRNLSLVIFTCDKFSDLWDAGLSLLEQNWGNRNIKTYLVTDAPTDRRFNDVEVISAGVGSEMSQRMKKILDIIDTDYLLVTLDDYFFTKPIDDSKIERCLQIVEKEKIDYFRLYTFINAKYFKEKYADYPDVYRVTTDARYNINLYPAIFSKAFLMSTVDEVKNAWQYEVSLTRKGAAYGANCALIRPNALYMLDVVRKGKLLRPAARYLKKNGLYHGNRPVMELWPYVKINAVYLLKRILPRSMVNWIRRILMQLGFHFYSEEYKEK